MCRLYSEPEALRSKKKARRVLRPELQYLHILQSVQEKFRGRSQTARWLLRVCRNRQHNFLHQKMEPPFLRTSSQSSVCFYSNSPNNKHTIHICSIRIFTSSRTHCWSAGSFTYLPVDPLSWKVPPSKRHNRSFALLTRVPRVAHDECYRFWNKLQSGWTKLKSRAKTAKGMLKTGENWWHHFTFQKMMRFGKKPSFPSIIYLFMVTQYKWKYAKWCKKLWGLCSYEKFWIAPLSVLKLGFGLDF